MTAPVRLLFDVDGVLLDSGAHYQRIWSAWASMRALDPSMVCAHAQGRRSTDTIRQVAPHLDLAAECVVLNDLMKKGIDTIPAAQGAVDLLCALDPGTWAIVTSGNRWSVQRSFTLNGLPLPAVQIYGENVQRAKPAPDPYLLAAQELGVRPDSCVVIEDTPAGVAAGRGAGCTVFAIAATYTCDQLKQADRCFPTLRAARHILWSIAKNANE